MLIKSDGERCLVVTVPVQELFGYITHFRSCLETLDEAVKEAKAENDTAYILALPPEQQEEWLTLCLGTSKREEKNDER